MLQSPNPVQSERRVAREGWTPIPPGQLTSWNETLLSTDAHLYQYPYWNEPLRRVRLTPEYLVYRSDGEPAAYIAILRLGIPFFRIGLIRGGPVSLTPGGEIPAAAFERLFRWARGNGYFFLRFSHPDSTVAERIAALPNAARVDPFPVYPGLEFDLIVEQREDETEMLASFQRIARRNIRDASAVGYELQVTDDAAALIESWPLFEALSERKGVQVYSRPMDSYVDMVQLAKPHGAVRLYMARLNGKLVESIVVIRDGKTAHYVAGALDIDALDGHGSASPTTLLHWKAMRDFHSLGVKTYSLGLTAYAFKEKFRPVRRDFPSPVTVATRPLLYRIWMGLEPLARCGVGRLRRFIARLPVRH
jgi:hypothetical protein